MSRALCEAVVIKFENKIEHIGRARVRIAASLHRYIVTS